MLPPTSEAFMLLRHYGALMSRMAPIYWEMLLRIVVTWTWHFCRSAGNALGCLGLFYASTESGLDYVNDGRYPDLLNSLGAGGCPRSPLAS